MDLADSVTALGLDDFLEAVGVHEISRTQLLRAEYGDQVPSPWTAEIDLTLPTS